MKNYKEEDYERGVKHGNEGKYAHPPSILDNLGGEGYVKGKQFAYDQRINNPPRENKEETTSKSSNSASPNASSNDYSSGYSSDYSGSSSTGGFGCLAIVGIGIVVFLVLALLSPSSSTKSSNPEMGGPLYQDKGYLGNGNYRKAPEVSQGRFGNFVIADFKVIVPYDGQYDLEVLAKKPGENKFRKASVKHARKLGTSMTIQLYEEYPTGTKFKAKFYF